MYTTSTVDKNLGCLRALFGFIFHLPSFRNWWTIHLNPKVNSERSTIKKANQLSHWVPNYAIHCCFLQMVMSKQLHTLYTVTNELTLSTLTSARIRGICKYLSWPGYLYYRSHLCHLETKIEVREGSAASGEGSGCFREEISGKFWGERNFAMFI